MKSTRLVVILALVFGLIVIDVIQMISKETDDEIIVRLEKDGKVVSAEKYGDAATIEKNYDLDIAEVEDEMKNKCLAQVNSAIAELKAAKLLPINAEVKFFRQQDDDYVWFKLDGSSKKK
ncbi:MAG: hypothetical protein WCT37_01525 [Patescibacteria group bacterium]|jgi:hypothetical protein